MFKETWCVRKPGPGYHRLLVLNNIRMIFDTHDTAQRFIQLYLDTAQGWYIDQYKAFEVEIVLDKDDVRLRDWRRSEVERKQRTFRNYIAAG
jgi:hypothetical protein